MRIRAVIVGVMFALIGFASASCGEGETEQDRVSAAVERLQGYMAAGRFHAVCSELAPKPRRQIGSVGHGRKPTTCERDVREFVQSAESYIGPREVGLRRARKPEVVAVDIASSGDAATATLALSDGDPFQVPLVREGGRWKLDDFLGATAPPPKELR